MDGRSGRLALLAIVLAATAASVYQPHWRPDEGNYEYPVHLDEYVHWGYARAIQRGGHIGAPDPFTDPGGVEARLEAARYPTEIHERGFQAFLAIFQAVTGISWPTLFEYGPMAVGLLLALAIFGLAERWNAGVESAAWVAALVTSLRFLGPGFLVPIAFSAPLLIVGVHVLTRAAQPRHFIAAGAVAAALWSIHAMGALIFSALALLVATTRPVGRMLVVAISVLTPALLAWPYYAQYLSRPAGAIDQFPISLDVIRSTGPGIMLFAAVGSVALAIAGTPVVRRIGNAFAIALTAAAGVLVYRASTGLDVLGLYDRVATSLPIIGLILAGSGVVAMRELMSPLTTRANVQGTALFAMIVLFLLQAAIVSHAMTVDATQPYYHVLDDSTYSRYSAVAETEPPPGSKALVDGITTMAWTDITGMPTLYVQSPNDAAKVPEWIEAFLSAGSADTPFLIQHGVSYVVTSREVTNPDLIPVGGGIYRLDPAIEARMRT